MCGTGPITFNHLRHEFKYAYICSFHCLSVKWHGLYIPAQVGADNGFSATRVCANMVYYNTSECRLLISVEQVCAVNVIAQMCASLYWHCQGTVVWFSAAWICTDIVTPWVCDDNLWFIGAQVYTGCGFFSTKVYWNCHSTSVCWHSLLQHKRADYGFSRVSLVALTIPISAWLCFMQVMVNRSYVLMVHGAVVGWLITSQAWGEYTVTACTCHLCNQ